MKAIVIVCSVTLWCSAVLSIVVPAAALATASLGRECAVVRAANDEQLVGLLSSKSDSQKTAAAMEAGVRRLRAAVPALRQLLQDDAEGVRYAAAAALLDVDDTSGISIVRARLTSEGISAMGRRFAARNLAEHGDLSGIDIARANLGSELYTARMDSIVVLSYSLDAREAEAALQAGAKDRVVLVRITTTRCLGRRGDDASITLLSTMLRDDDVNVRAGAAVSLADTRRCDALPLLLGALADPTEAVVGRASAMLQKLTGYKPVRRSGSDAANRKLEAEWLEWWRSNQAQYPAGGKCSAPK
jgi:HEAT repeat protein